MATRSSRLRPSPSRPVLPPVERSGPRVPASLHTDPEGPRSRSEADRALLHGLATRTRTVERRGEVLEQGEVPGLAHVLLEGHTCRYRRLRSGRRQITALLVPGDLCDVEAVVKGRADFGVAALTPCRLGEIPGARIREATDREPEVAAVLLRRLRLDEAIAREWIVNLGNRDATARMAHLLCEVRARLDAVGLAGEDGYALPLGQGELGEALGLSSVHVNRVLRELRVAGLVTLANRRLTIHDRPGLERLADFDPAYLSPQ